MKTVLLLAVAVLAVTGFTPVAEADCASSGCASSMPLIVCHDALGCTPPPEDPCEPMCY